MTVLLQTHIYIPPTALDRTWHQALMMELNRRYKNASFPHDGFVITTIHSISKIHDMMITSTSGYVRCLLDFYATTFLPKIGTRIQAKIDLISPHGVILSHPYIQIIIPTDQLRKDGFEIRSSFSSISFCSPNRVIIPHSIITVELLKTRYENQSFISIGRYCEEE